jgi:cytochrome c biogenesis protein
MKAPAASSVAARLWLERLASLKVTLVVLVMLAVGVVIAYQSAVRATWSLVLPLSLIALNLGAAVATNRVFRRQTSLLVFHLALIAIILLVAAGRLTYLKGQLELAEGEEFAGDLVTQDAGPFHWWRLDRIRLANDGFTIEYAAGVKRGPTRNRLRYSLDDGPMQHAVIGDNEPLVLHGYRFYTSFNKGFAPAFLWHPKRGEAQLGTVHLPAYPMHEYRQAREWTLPGTSTAVWTQLQFDEVILDPDKPSSFRLPQVHTLVLRVGELRAELRPGESIELPDGRLEYRGLRAWMGYTVFSDWTISWLLAASALAVASLAAHFWRKFAARPWNP